MNLAMPRKKPRITQAEYEILADFRHALRRFLRFSEDAAAAAGITPQQHQALLAIKGSVGKEKITVGTLAERLQILHHSAVGLTDRLVQHGYIKKTRGSQDRRQVYLGLTHAGNRTLERLTEAHREQLRQLGPQLRLLLHTLDKEPQG